MNKVQVDFTSINDTGESFCSVDNYTNLTTEDVKRVNKTLTGIEVIKIENINNSRSY